MAALNIPRVPGIMPIKIFATSRLSVSPVDDMGRLSTFSQEAAEEICARLAKGEPLAHICRDEGMPSVRTVSDWKAAHDEFAAGFARARDEGYDAIAADCLDIADDTTKDTIYGEGGERADTEWIGRSKLRIETRLKLLARWDPKRYGDRITQEHTGANGAGLFADLLKAVDGSSLKVVPDE